MDRLLVTYWLKPVFSNCSAENIIMFPLHFLPGIILTTIYLYKKGQYLNPGVKYARYLKDLSIADTDRQVSSYMLIVDCGVPQCGVGSAVKTTSPSPQMNARVKKFSLYVFCVDMGQIMEQK